MATTVQETRAAAQATGAPLVVVSSDTHIGPLVQEQLRPYCPAALLSEFDDFVAQITPRSRPSWREDDLHEQTGFQWNWQTEGHFDIAARLRDMDADGVAAEVIFHGSQNGQPLPFQSAGFSDIDAADYDRVACGQHIYNQWLADQVSVQSERHIGVAHLAMWDIDAAIKELEWAATIGLRSVNFPAPRAGVLPYNRREWDPFWSACEALDMTLSSHAGAGNIADWSGPEAIALFTIESGGFASRRALQFMIFGGVFERHPKLKLILTEQPGDWWKYTQDELDSAYLAHRRVIAHQVPRKPSEYMHENVYLGAAFMARFEVDAALRNGYADRILWGSDYPHAEGTYQYPREGEEVPATRLCLRHAFASASEADIRRMVGETAVEVYGLDARRLAEVAKRINAPTPEELARPLADVPAHGGGLTYRTFGPWA